MTRTWTPDPELFELVTWEEIREGDHVWSMGGVCVITRGAFRSNGAYDPGMTEGFMRFGHRSESGSEFAPPMELTARVPRLIPPGRKRENYARPVLANAIYGLQQDMLHQGEDITDDHVWQPAKREFLRWLIHLAHRELSRTTTTTKENQS
jgi:hypothetical protein